jgi:hypothetical protein
MHLLQKCWLAPSLPAWSGHGQHAPCACIVITSMPHEMRTKCIQLWQGLTSGLGFPSSSFRVPHRFHFAIYGWSRRCTKAAALAGSRFMGAALTAATSAWPAGASPLLPTGAAPAPCCRSSLQRCQHAMTVVATNASAPTQNSHPRGHSHLHSIEEVVVCDQIGAAQELRWLQYSIAREHCNILLYHLTVAVASCCEHFLKTGRRIRCWQHLAHYTGGCGGGSARCCKCCRSSGHSRTQRAGGCRWWALANSFRWCTLFSGLESLEHVWDIERP